MNTLHISNVKYPKMKVCITLSKPYRNVKLEINGRTVEDKYFLTYKKRVTMQMVYMINIVKSLFICVTVNYRWSK